jgi:tetratricopeptide (TPR) repeat protein
MTYRTSFRNPVRLFLLLLTVVSVWGCGDSEEARKQKFLARGLNSLREGNGEQAIYYFNQSLSLDSCFSDALNNIGTVHFNEQRYYEALAFYSRAVDCNTGFLNGYFNRANTLIKTGNYDRALSDLEFIIHEKPDTAIAHFTRGLALSRVRRYDEALEAFHDAGELDTSLTVDARINAAAVMILAKRYELAKAELRACAAMAPKEGNIYNSLALIYAEEKKYDSAFEMVNRALALSSDEPFFLNNRGFIQMGRGNMDAAESDINQSITIDPYNAWAYRNKGILFLYRKEPVEAERLLRRAIEIDPYIDRVHFYLGVSFAQQGMGNEACASFRQSEDHGEGMVTTELKGCK